MAAVSSKKRRRYRLHGVRTLVTREIAALDFLQKIPMAREEDVIRDAIANTRDEDEIDGDNSGDDSDDDGDREAAASNADARGPLAVWSVLSSIRRSIRAAFTSGAGALGRSGLDGGRKGVAATGGDAMSEQEVDGTANGQAGSAQAQPLENPLNLSMSGKPTFEQRPGTLPGSALEGLLSGGAARDDTFGVAIARAALTAHSQVIGRRLAGPNTPDVGIPPEIRYRLSREGNAKVRQWEQETVHTHGMERSRIFMSCSRGYPLAVTSVIRYDPGEEEKRRRREKLLDQRAASVFRIEKRDWRGVSFAHLLPSAQSRLRGWGARNRNEGMAALADGVSKLDESRGSKADNQSGGAGSNKGGSGDEGRKVASGLNESDDGLDSKGSGSSSSGGGGGENERAESALEGVDDYEPGVVDDPNMGQGKYCQVIRGDDALGPVVCSVLKFAKSKDLKDELNNQWRERHPEMPSNLSLSKIRNLKTEALNGCCNDTIDCEAVTVAYACIYFERLCLRGIVTKANRRLSMATCLMLAFKFSEPLHIGGRDPRMKMLLEFIDDEWSISPDEVHDAEFGLLVLLEFRLHCSSEHLTYHFQRLVKAGLHQSVREYLRDDALFRDWIDTPRWQVHNTPLPACRNGLPALRLAEARRAGKMSARVVSNIDLALDDARNARPKPPASRRWFTAPAAPAPAPGAD